jgi:hypothetical protein
VVVGVIDVKGQRSHFISLPIGFQRVTAFHARSKIDIPSSAPIVDGFIASASSIDRARGTRRHAARVKPAPPDGASGRLRGGDQAKSGREADSRIQRSDVQQQRVSF